MRRLGCSSARVHHRSANGHFQNYVIRYVGEALAVASQHLQIQREFEGSKRQVPSQLASYGA